MNFKKPRDPNTKPDHAKLRDVYDFENIRCEVGSGECHRLAVESQDNGEGGEFFLCADHAKEFSALGKLIAEMTPNQMSNFENAVTEQERKEP